MKRLFSGSAQAVQVLEHLVGMIRRRDRLVSRGHLSVRADQHGHALWPRGVGIANAVRHRHRFIRIAAQVVRKAEFLLKRAVVFRRIEADAQDHRILVGKRLDSITEPIALDGSPGCIGFRVPPQEDIFSRVLVKRHTLAVLIGQRE